jgi:hypothetical protein
MNSNNTIKNLPCYYTSTPIGKKEGSQDCPKFATRTFFDESKDRTYPLCEEHYQKVSKQKRYLVN